MSAQRKIETDRYPGPKPYEESEKDLFFGRSQETEALFESVSVNNVFVLHAESGLGKSSLIAAGLMPRLRTGNYLPVLIRFKNRKTSPMKAVTDAIHEACRKNFRDTQSYTDSIALSPDEETDTWKLVKKINFQGYVPVLIFDQFEEFNYFPVETRRETIQKLAELTALRLPDHIRRETSSSGRTVPENWYSQPEVKLIFSIRTDRIGIMEELADAIPDTRTNRYELSPMMAEQGEQVIILPAAMESSEDIFFNSQPFQYEPGLIKTILEIVRRKNNTIDTTQLQIICLEIQERVKNKITQDEMLVVTEKELGGKTGLEDLVKNFYVKQLSKISEKENIDPVEYQSIRVLLEKKMIVQGKKDRLSEDTIFQHFRNRDIKEERMKPLLDELLSLRLIRGIDFEESTFYEIAHDTLISPILQEMENRERKEAVEKEKKQAEELARTQAEELRKQRLQTAKEVELRKKATEAEIHAREEERKAKEAEEKARAAERKANEVAAELSKNVAKLEDAVRRKRRMQRVIFGAVVILFLLGIFLVYYLLQTRNSRRQVNVLTAYKQYITGDSAYDKANHAVAASNFIASSKEGNTDALDKINSLPFSPLSWTDSTTIFSGFFSLLFNNIIFSPDKKQCLLLKGQRPAELWDLRNDIPEKIDSFVQGQLKPVFSASSRYLMYYRNKSFPLVYDIKNKKSESIVPAFDNMEMIPALQIGDSRDKKFSYIPEIYAFGDNYFILSGKGGKDYLVDPTGGSEVRYYLLADFIGANPMDISREVVKEETRYTNTHELNKLPYEISPDGNYLSSYNALKSMLFIYDINRGKQILSFRQVKEFWFTDDTAGFHLLDNYGNLLKGDCKTLKYNFIRLPGSNTPDFDRTALTPDKKKLYLRNASSEMYEYVIDLKDDKLYALTEILKKAEIVSNQLNGFSLQDIYFKSRDESTNTWLLFNMKTGDSVQANFKYENDVISSINSRQIIIKNNPNKLTVLNAETLEPTGEFDTLNIDRIYFDEMTSRVYFTDTKTNEIIEIDCVANKKRSLGKLAAVLVGTVNGHLELASKKANMLTGTRCLVNPDKLALKGDEKITYLRELFKIRKLPGEK